MSKKNTGKNFKRILAFSTLIFVLSLCGKFVLCGATTIENGKVQDIFSKKSALEKEISRLSYIDSTLSSISYVEGKAKSIGFTNMDSRLNALDPTAPIQVAALSR
jgi:hypothetical protein